MDVVAIILILAMVGTLIFVVIALLKKNTELMQMLITRSSSEYVQLKKVEADTTIRSKAIDSATKVELKNKNKEDSFDSEITTG
ncbi:MAG: hypothetical protein PF450_10520 [Bacteroidales bacterium]|jgi:hypothetical protein|nr:hypothetical protein [Bacteroidales bacterium]